MNIIRGMPEQASALTGITIASKRHWGYPEKWIQLWTPELTFSPEYVSENEVWTAVVDERPVAYYSLKLQPVTPALAYGASVARAPLFFARSNLQDGEGLLTCTATNAVRRKCRREEHPPRNDIDSLWLENLWVLPKHMGQGIGKRLFQHALERSRVYGVSCLKIEADPNAQSFYEKMGARKVSEHQYELDGQLRVLPIMEIDL